ASKSSDMSFTSYYAVILGSPVASLRSSKPRLCRGNHTLYFKAVYSAGRHYSAERASVCRYRWNSMGRSSVAGGILVVPKAPACSGYFVKPAGIALNVAVGRCGYRGSRPVFITHVTRRVFAAHGAGYVIALTEVATVRS